MAASPKNKPRSDDYAQDLKGGLKDGIQREYYPDHKLRREKEYLAGKAQGKDILYYYSGKVHMERAFVAGELQGRSTEFNEDGSVRAEFSFDKGKIAGEAHKEDSYGRMQYIADKPQNGLFKEYFSDGVLKKETPYAQGKISGIVTTYSHDGTLSGQSEYRGGMNDGLNKTYDKQGRIVHESCYNKGDFIWSRVYNPDGTVKSEMAAGNIRPCPAGKEPADIFKDKADIESYFDQSVLLKRAGLRIMSGFPIGPMKEKERARLPPLVMANFDDWQRATYGLCGTTGLVVVGVTEPGNIPFSEVRRGDELIEANGIPVSSFKALADAVSDSGPGEAPFRFKRGDYEWIEYMPMLEICRTPEFVVDPIHQHNLAWTDGKRIVVMSRQMMEMIKNEDELALVVSHELAHIELGHYEARNNMQLAEAIGAGLVSGFVTALLNRDSRGKPAAYPYTNQFVGDAAGQLAGKAMMSPFSKEQESAADSLGLAMLTRAGYDGRRAIQIMARIPDATMVNFTHPEAGDRYEELLRQIDAGGAA